MNPSSRVFDIRTNDPAYDPAATNIDGAQEIAIRISGAGRQKIILQDVQLARMSGSGVTNYTPFITNNEGAGSTDFWCKWIGAATAVGSILTDSDIRRLVVTDDEGYIYLTVGGDSGDEYRYEISYEVVG